MRTIETVKIEPIIRIISELQIINNNIMRYYNENNKYSQY